MRAGAHVCREGAARFPRGQVVATSKHDMKAVKTKLQREPYASNDLFRRIAAKTSHGVGSPWAFVVALSIVIVWGVTGPIFRFSDTWQLVINTGTTIVTFLMVFLIQNTQNRDSHALHLKLDELIRANKVARNRLMGLEDLSDDELDELQNEFNVLAREKLAARSRPPPHRAAHKPVNGTTAASKAPTQDRRE
jgi:low affinity Fe/Cu permease